MTDNAPHHRGTGLAFAALMLGNVILAFGPWLVRLAEIGPVASAFWRVAIALPLLFLMARATRQPLVLGRGLVLILLAGGLFFALDLASWHSGILRTKLANATLFGNITSFTFAAYGFFQARKLPGRMQGIALLLAAIGVTLLLGRSYEVSARHFIGDLLCIAAGFFYTFYLVAIDHARGRIASWSALAWSTAGAVPTLLIAALIMGQPLAPTDWTPLLLLAIGSQVIGQGLVVYAVGHLSPVLVGISLLVQPVVAATIGWIFYDERLGGLDLVGMLVVAVAIVLIRRADPPRQATAG